jgi:N-acyl-L-homoserine lactone synthetase
MQQSGLSLASKAAQVFPKLAPLEGGTPEVRVRVPRPSPVIGTFKARTDVHKGSVRASTLSFLNMHQYGDLLVNFLRARKRTFVEQLGWNLPEVDGMEFDQYDTPFSRWVVIYEYGEVLGGIRLTPTTASCGIYSYMLRDAQRGLLAPIPSDVLFFKAPVDRQIWEASRLFISKDVPAQRRVDIQAMIMNQMADAAREQGASHVIGIVPAVWSRWLRRLDLDAVPVGPKFAIDGTVSQAALFGVIRYAH